MVEYAQVSQEGYEHEASKSIRGDKFCGLLLDEINQEELTDERIEQWVEQLRAGGFFDDAGAPPTTDVVTTAVSQSVIEPVLEQLAKASAVMEETIAQHSSGGFSPHFNPVSGKTMVSVVKKILVHVFNLIFIFRKWTSADGRKSYVT